MTRIDQQYHDLNWLFADGEIVILDIFIVN
jgi:hypothetical protein